MSLFSWLPESWSMGGASDADVRAEVWKLGVRHHGEPLTGAQAELKAGGLSAERTQLLQACVRKLKRAPAN
jgi:hypothetical protein